MSGIATAAIVGSVATGVMSSRAQSKASKRAAEAQTEASEQSIEEQRRQFDAIQELLKPYVNAGTGALSQQQALLGLSGEKAQQQAISNLSESPEMRAYLQQGENAILQNSSATGGLRGGNTQSALAQFRPQLLNQLINQRYSQLGGLTSMGQNAAAGVGNAGMQSAGNIGNLLQQQGAATAGGILAGGQAAAQNWGNVSQMFGQLAGYKLGGGKF